MENSGQNTKKSNYKIDDIAYSDSDTLPEFSNRDNSLDSAEDSKHVILIRANDQLIDKEKSCEKLGQEIKNLKIKFKFYCAPHLCAIHLSNIIISHLPDRPSFCVTNQFGEPKNEKITALNANDIKNLKMNIIIGRDEWIAKNETADESSKRLETAFLEVMAVFPHVVLVCGPVAYEMLIDVLTKQKRKITANSKPCHVGIEQFQKKDREWVRIKK